MPQGPQVQPVTIQELVKDSDEASTVVNRASWTGSSPPVDQRDVPSPGKPQIQTLTSQDTAEESEAVEPQSRVSNKWRKCTESKKKENIGGNEAELSTIAIEHKSKDSEEDDENVKNEPGLSSTPQPFDPVLPVNQEPATSSQGPAASTNFDVKNSEKSDE